jgi:hypothetical protein
MVGGTDRSGGARGFSARTVSCAAWALTLVVGPALVIAGGQGIAAAASKPAVKAFTVSRASVGSTGGKVTLTAKVAHATSCTFSAKPHLAGLPKRVHCSLGKATKVIKIPANSSPSTRSFVITLTVKGAGGKVSKAKTISQAAKPLSWGAPALIDPAQGLPTSVSCPTATFCVEVDDHGLASTFNGTSWSALTAIDLNLSNVLGYNPLTAVSCASASFCIAIDQYGHEVTFNGSSWSAAKNIDAGRELLAVSCPTTTFCAAVDNEGYALTDNAGTWSSPASLDVNPLAAVSCQSSSFCVAADGSSLITYNGTKWSSPALIDQNNTLTTVSCPTSTFCVAADNDDQAFTFDGTTASAAKDLGISLVSVSCVTTSFCIGVDQLGNYVKYTGGTSWTNPSRVMNVGVSVSCPTTGFCAAVDYGGSQPSQGYLGGGHAYTFNGTTWSGATLIDATGGGGFTAVSCPTATFCTAVDNTGHAVTYNGKRWSHPVRAEGYSTSGFFAISCASRSYCVALDGQGQAVTYDGTGWSGPTTIDNTKGLTSVSCPTSAFCVAVDYSGNAITYTHSGGWSNAISVDAGQELSSVSCPTASFCVAVDSGNRVLTDKLGTWSTPRQIDGDPESNLTSVSCTSASSCVAIEHYGPPGEARALVYNGSKWSRPTTFTTEYADDSMKGTTVVSCATKTFCDAVGTWGSASYNAPKWSADKKIDKDGALTDVSCPTVDLCIAVDRTGRMVTGTL